MRFYQTLLAGAAIVAGVLAQKPTIDNVPSNIKAGETYEVTFSPKTATAKFVLRKGPSNNLGTVGTLTESATGGKFSWTVAKNLVDGSDYALQIFVGSEDNYSGQFPITGGTGTSASSSASSASSSARSTGSSSASRSASTSGSLTTSASASASISSSVGSNSTITTGVLSSTASPTGARTTGSGSQTTSSGPPQATGAASTLSSPFALLFGAVAAFAYLQ